MNSASAPRAMQPSSELASGNQVSTKGRILAWASWDWGSAAFNAVMTTFVFTVYLTSNAFGGKDEASAVLGGALAVAGLAIALLAPVTGQRSDAGGRRKLWLGVNTAAVAVLTGLCFFVFPQPEFLLLGVTLIALGNVFFEFAGVNYNAMLAQISTPRNIGKVSGIGWGAGYLGGIVALLIVLQLFVQPSFEWFGASTQDSLNIRLVAVFSALWFFIFALPVLFAVPELPRTGRAARLGIVASYRLLFRRIRAIYATSPHTIYFLLASAVFRDGLAAVFTFGGIIAAGTFGFELSQVIFFAIFGNVVAAVGAIIGGFLDDRVGPKAVIIGSLAGLLVAGTVILVLGNGDYSFFGMDWAGSTTFWVFGLFLCLFVGPAQSSSRAYLARLAPHGESGELFGLYATTGRAVSFLAPALFTLCITVATPLVAAGEAQRWGILGIMVVLLAGLLVLLPVKSPDKAPIAVVPSA
ncbi:major facilitator superfamily MFS_1 [Pseudarthrobacter chlorophenolicus A6]|uniref:Major facilitator superfamily MFS_1 n=1 Tax=Pseudarthrobacter chlorophenolicus (strain ATCC 700700 / DSM 12829 / CIP 107037 / JCM 12360 / KCTC 9906 / NCIMB 13794 / A6) TaxID=452863 RepID=B8H714_PSECP|nr:MFS transporter [Pseudarthrobacter chlorophenolicus]ACL41616.1 major facilitator superfamily MFS_1 [Pseudarthrobacter chlorophenolicus A6]SDQ61173.1 MFS transporter, UMF1 family [Pseudarthrobacter chlorophenolicus]